MSILTNNLNFGDSQEKGLEDTRIAPHLIAEIGKEFVDGEGQGDDGFTILTFTFVIHRSAPPDPEEAQQSAKSEPGKRGNPGADDKRQRAILQAQQMLSSGQRNRHKDIIRRYDLILGLQRRTQRTHPPAGAVIVGNQ
jgi:hypothetical protein